MLTSCVFDRNVLALRGLNQSVGNWFLKIATSGAIKKSSQTIVDDSLLVCPDGPVAE